MSTVKILRSTVAGHVPSALQSGQIAINEADGILFYLDADGNTIHAVNLLQLSSVTPGPNEDSTKVATTEWVKDKIDALVGAAPPSLNTLVEIALAINNDPDFYNTIATALTNRIRFDQAQTLNGTQLARVQSNIGLASAISNAITSANLATLASPALTGNPTAPDQALSDYSTKLANTHFVVDYVGDAIAKTVTINAMMDAITGSKSFGGYRCLNNMFADGFCNTDGIDPALSSNVAIVTSNRPTGGINVCNPNFAISSGDNPTYPKAQAFDGNAGTIWYSSNVLSGGTGIANVAYIGQNFGANFPQDITSALLTQNNSLLQAVVAVKVQWSSDGSTWTTVGTFPTYLGSQPQLIGPWPSVGPKQYWRLLAASELPTNGYGWSVGELQFLTASQPNQNGFVAPSPSSAPLKLFPESMSANNVPSPYVASATTTTGGSPWALFSATADSFWQAPNGAQAVNIDLGANAGSMYAYALRAYSSSTSNMPFAWTLEGSNDNAAWTVLDTRMGEGNWQASETRFYQLATPSASYRYYRIRPIAPVGNGANFIIQRWLAWKTPTINNMTLVTVAQPTSASVSKARILIEYQAIDAITLNTDLTAEVSCDGGAHWASASLSLITSNGGGKVQVLVGESSDISCTAGTSYLARVKTQNNKNVRVTGLALAVH